MRHVTSAAAAVLLLVLSALAIPAASAGQADATPITEGTYTGSVGGYSEQWYQIAVPAGKVVHVTFEVTAGDAWRDLRLVNAEGSVVAWVDSGGAGVYDPDDADAWLVVSAGWNSVNYAFTVSLINAPPQDDAGSGMDAGQQLSTALPIQPGRIAGKLLKSSGDVADWYRLDLPAGTIVDLHSATVDVYVVNSWGAGIGHVDSSSWWGTPTFAFVTNGEPIYLAVTYDYGPSYAFSVDVSLRADLRVEQVKVDEVEVVTPAGPTGLSPHRSVEVALANVGEGPSRKATLQVFTTHEGPTGQRLLHEQAVDLASGETLTMRVPWDTTGQVGDFTVVARLVNEFEAVPDDNEAGEEVSLVASGLARGVDALNHEARVSSVTLRTEYGGERIGAWTPAGFVGYQGGVLTAA